MNQKKSISPRDHSKYEFAYMLYMQQVSQNEICKKVDVSAPTLKSWKEAGNWEAKRASRIISIDDLLQKALKKINELLEAENFNADSFAKAVKQLKELKTRNTVDDEINTFLSFQDYLLQQQSVNQKEITDQFIKTVVRYQDQYIKYRLKSGK